MQRSSDEPWPLESYGTVTLTRSFRAALLGLVLIVATSPNAVWATDALEPIGISAQSRMRGGADVAVGDSALSQIDNPATLSLSPRGLYSFDEASKLAFIDLPWSGPLGQSESSTRIIHLHNAGIAIPKNDRLTFGLALHSKCGLGTSFDMRYLMIPFMKRHVYSDMKNIALHADVAYKVTDKLSLGAGLRGEVATSKFGLVLGPADVTFGRGYAYGVGFDLGLHYQATRTLAFGLAYRSPTWFGDLSGGQGKASLFGVLPVPLGGIALSDLELPQRVAAGAAWDVTPRFKLLGETRWTNYANSSFHNTTVSTDGWIDLRYPMPMGYQDIWAFMVGGEYKLDKHWVLASGYHFVTTPINRAYLLPIADVPVQHHATIGLRYETPRWWVGCGYVVGFCQTLTGPGYSHIPLGFEYGVSRISQTQHMISMGFGFRW
jgi:long-subunit fatty acid transport protein